MEKIEADVAEALTVIESNHVAGKKLDYNDLFKSSIDGIAHARPALELLRREGI